MKKRNKILLAISVIILLASCSKGTKKVMLRYDNKQPSIVYYYKNIGGKQTKVYEEHFYPNGKKRCFGKCIGENRDGIWKFCFEDGSLFAQADFSNKKEGEKWQVKFSKDSILVDKKDTILAIAFSNEGTPVSIRVKKENIEVYYRFFNSFKVMEKVCLKGNVPDGESMSWFENGNINSVHYYKSGFQDSLYVVYAETGQKIISGNYHLDKKVGKWEYFNSEGKPLGIDVYDVDGTKLVSREDSNLIIIHHTDNDSKK